MYGLPHWTSSSFCSTHQCCLYACCNVWRLHTVPALPAQVVMSRTFGNASPQGGVGVRMCVPLIDMLNHAGDEAVDGLLSTGSMVSQDNVRWDVVSPDNSASGGWEMVLSATKDIADGEPLLLSYREGPNEEFMLCYGFVPPSNPHDTVQLFGGLIEALEHLWQQELSQVCMKACPPGLTTRRGLLPQLLLGSCC